MDQGLVVFGVGVPLLHLVGQVPDPVQEALAALHGVVRPSGGLFEVADEHNVHAHGVRPVLGHHVIGVDHVPPGLGHLFPALAQDHAMAGALVVGLREGDHPQVIEELVPEPGVEQVEGGVLHAAVVPVHLAPVF